MDHTAANNSYTAAAEANMATLNLNEHRHENGGVPTGQAKDTGEPKPRPQVTKLAPPHSCLSIGILGSSFQSRKKEETLLALCLHWPFVDLLLTSSSYFVPQLTPPRWTTEPRRRYVICGPRLALILM